MERKIIIYIEIIKMGIDTGIQDIYDINAGKCEIAEVPISLKTTPLFIEDIVISG